MSMKPSAKGATPTGRKTPTSIRPPSPKVDLSTKKVADSRPSPSSKQLSSSLNFNRKSPSNLLESNFLAQSRQSSRKHEFDPEQASVQSVFNDSQLAKIKLVVDSQRLHHEDHESDYRQFHSVSHNASRRLDHGYDTNNAYSNEFGSGGGGESFYQEANRSYSNEAVLLSRSLGCEEPDSPEVDCAVSDITQEATYMSINNNNERSRSQAIAASASASGYGAPHGFEPSSLPDEALESMLRAITEEKARREKHAAAVIAAATAAAEAAQQQQQINAAQEAGLRKHVKRSKSGGSEAMMTSSATAAKKSNTASASSAHGVKALPSFHTYRQQLDASGSDHLSVVSVSDDAASAAAHGHRQYHGAATPCDREVEHALQGLQHAAPASAIQPVQSTSPFIRSGGAVNTLHPAASSLPVTSPAGVSSANFSRGTTLSRGSGAYVPVEKMWGDANLLLSPSAAVTSPLVYVESPNTTAALSASVNLSGKENSGRPASAGSSHKQRLLESALRDAKQYESSVASAKQQQHAANAEPQFMPLEHSSHGGAHKERVQSHALNIVRPNILARSVSIGSDGSSVDGMTMNMLAYPALNAAATAAAAAAPGHRALVSEYDALLTRELLVSPLSAFDDCASQNSGWSLNSGSRRSSASHSKHHAHSKHSHQSHSHKTSDRTPHHHHYTSATVSSSTKSISVTPIKRQQY